MALNLSLSTLAMPDGTEFPGTPELLNDLLVQYTEITGQDSFNGINYGSTTPDASNRDKPWYRLDNSDNEMGWYAWDGSDWVLLLCRVQVGTAIQQSALTAPQDGQLYFVTGSSALNIYQGGSWKPVIPTQTRFHYDSSHLYPQHQLLASTTAEVTSWTAIDLTPYIAAAGLDAQNDNGDPKYVVKGAMIRVEISQGQTGFSGPNTWDASVRVSSSDSGSTTATDVLQARSFMAADDSATASASTGYGIVPPKTSTNNIYYTVIKASSAVNNLSAKVWLTGFVYTTTDAAFP